jgi:hypothetical protein
MLQGSSGNLRRALKREQAEDDAPPLSAEQQTELEQLNELIAQTLRACKRGCTFRGKRNPAYANLSSLIKARDLLMRGRRSGKKSTAALLADADKLLATGAN